MKYLFFDIESADGVYSMCEFGYVLTDENFNVIKKDCFVMNPEYSFKNLKTKDGKFIVPLHFSESQYRNSPTFPHYAKNIISLLTDLETIIFGYSVSNDLVYVLQACSRYKIPLFNFVVHDVQSLYKKYENNKIIGLDHAMINLFGEEKFNKMRAHYSTDDAYMTMLILKEILRKNNIAIETAIKNMSKPNSINQFKKMERRKAEQQRGFKNSKIVWNNFLNSHIYIQGTVSYYFCFGCRKNVLSTKQLIRFINIHRIPIKKNLGSADVVVYSSKGEINGIKKTAKIKSKEFISITEFHARFK